MKVWLFATFCERSAPPVTELVVERRRQRRRGVEGLPLLVLRPQPPDGVVAFERQAVGIDAHVTPTAPGLRQPCSAFARCVQPTCHRDCPLLGREPVGRGWQHVAGDAPGRRPTRASKSLADRFARAR